MYRISISIKIIIQCCSSRCCLLRQRFLLECRPLGCAWLTLSLKLILLLLLQGSLPRLQYNRVTLALNFPLRQPLLLHGHFILRVHTPDALLSTLLFGSPES